jgi:monovalent cation:H+ antiporter, CPA1 family
MDLAIVGTLSLLVVAILVAITARRLYLPYTVGLVIAGGVLALAHVQTGIRLTHDIIFELILPPLLFEAAINIHWHELRREMLPVLVLSIFGVVISAAIVSAGMVWLLAWPVASALVFAVLIAATDPVAVIAMFKDVGLTGRLRLLVESESLFNDGVAAVLFGLALSWARGSDGGITDAAWALMSTSLGGILIGLIAGAAGLVIVGRTADHLVETAVTLAVAYGAFLGAEYLRVSGVLATVSAGLLMGSVGIHGDRPRFGLSDQGRLFAVAFWEFLAFIANSFVFLLIGVTAARIPFGQLGYGALVTAILLVLLGRGATVYPLCLAFRGTSSAIGWREQHILWWGGLRGALALALALSLPTTLPMRDAIIIATFAVVAFSVLMQGLTMPALLRSLGLLPLRS